MLYRGARDFPICLQGPEPTKHVPPPSACQILLAACEQPNRSPARPAAASMFQRRRLPIICGDDSRIGRAIDLCSGVRPHSRAVDGAVQSVRSERSASRIASDAEPVHGVHGLFRPALVAGGSVLVVIFPCNAGLACARWHERKRGFGITSPSRTTASFSAASGDLPSVKPRCRWAARLGIASLARRAVPRTQSCSSRPCDFRNWHEREVTNSNVNFRKEP